MAMSRQARWMLAVLETKRLLRKVRDYNKVAYYMVWRHETSTGNPLPPVKIQPCSEKKLADELARLRKNEPSVTLSSSSYVHSIQLPHYVGETGSTEALAAGRGRDNGGYFGKAPQEQTDSSTQIKPSPTGTDDAA